MQNRRKSTTARKISSSGYHQRKKSGLTDHEEREAGEVFRRYRNRELSGRLPFNKLERALEDLQIRLAGHQLRQLLKDNPGWEKGLPEAHFLKVAGRYRSKNQATQANLKAVGKAQSMAGMTDDIFHTIKDDEKDSFCEWINSLLEADEYLTEQKILPIDPSGDDLFDKCRDGILLSKLVNATVPGTINEKKLHFNSSQHLMIHENNSILLDACRKIGCVVVNIYSKELVEGKQHLIFGLLWQIIRIGLLSNINLEFHPGLKKLVKKSESLEKFKKETAESILMRWVNYHIDRSKSARRMTNFTTDVSDSEVYSHLLYQIAPRHAGVTMDALKSHDKTERASIMLQQAAKIDCAQFVHPRDVVNGNYKLNLAFVANLFNKHTALDDKIVLDEVDGWLKLLQEGETMEDLRKLTEEEFLVRWVNHQLEGSKFARRVTNLSSDLQDGEVYCHLLKAVAPESCNVTLDPLDSQGAERVKQIFAEAEKADIDTKDLSVDDVLSGNVETNTIFVATLHNRFPNLSDDKKIDIKHPPQAQKLLKKGEVAEFFLYYKVEDFLIRWVNYHLGRCHCSKAVKKMTNYTDDLADSEIYVHLIKQIAPEAQKVSLSPLAEADPRIRAQKMIDEAMKIRCGNFISPDDVIGNDGKKNFEFLLELYNTHHGLNDRILVRYPHEVSKLLESGETSAKRIPIETLLMRWVNYHLGKSSLKRRLSNFTTDLADCEIYTHLIRQIAPPEAKATLGPLAHRVPMERAARMIQEAAKIQCGENIKPKDVVEGKDKYANVQFLAEIFNKRHALEEEKEQVQQNAKFMDTIEITDDDDKNA